MSSVLLIYTNLILIVQLKHKRLTNWHIQLGTEAIVSSKLKIENPMSKLSRANNCILLYVCSYSLPSNSVGEVGTFGVSVYFFPHEMLL